MSKLKDFDALRVPLKKLLHLKHIDPASTRHVPPRDEADRKTRDAVEILGQYQDRLYVNARQSLLVVLQGMDASGKDGTIRKVFDAVNPAGIQVTSFKQPSTEELRHDFLWRIHAKTPPRGFIGVFNRSHYEEVLVVRVHADHLLPPELRDKHSEWQRRYRMINAFESILTDASTRVVKFFLHISSKEQRERFEDRQKDPEKQWKLAAGDFTERGFWKNYQHAYEELLPATSTPAAPWYIIPADHKWVRNFWISHILTATMEEMDIQPPKIADKSLITRRFT